MPQHATDQNMQHCISECTLCHQLCIKTIQHCLGMGGKHAEQSHIRLMADCAQICATSADFMLRSSPLHVHTCRACAEVCQQCAQDCDRIGAGDDMMKQCADACRRCAESCHKMSAAVR